MSQYKIIWITTRCLSILKILHRYIHCIMSWVWYVGMTKMDERARSTKMHSSLDDKCDVSIRSSQQTPQRCKLDKVAPLESHDSSQPAVQKKKI